MKLFSIASGSSGNCVYVGSEQTHVLFDAGISTKRIVGGLADKFIQPENISGIFITHEHTDHISGLPVLMKKYQIPVYATEGTIQYLRGQDKLSLLPADLFRPIPRQMPLTIGDLIITACAIPHDAVDPVCYSISDGLKKIGLATDIGYVDDCLIRHLSESDLLYVESNYDRSMLLAGPYPMMLKRRILGEFGHLSNDESVELVRKVKHPGLKYIVLAHLSKENNYPLIAHKTMNNGLMDMWDYETDIPELMVASRDVPMEMLEIV